MESKNAAQYKTISSGQVKHFHDRQSLLAAIEKKDGPVRVFKRAPEVGIWNQIAELN